ncbi:TIGR01621 family pseudouridine synthase [Vibrio salinus]|uniref:TIGR01621 family pseudouridine synthase n=1 Tax=Vibrio salinus TaxID=2899784 RepID=UPI001E4B3582|nr:TIGR01621 family pseudouridine synthase [Vibrio salinus]MCE0492639.1 TIGR01621 family pseudouridine synthase [Vibrio salinus]
MFEIVYTHQDFIIINKFSGVSVHKDDSDIALVSEVSKRVDGKPLFLVHRLDKMTSGLLILARSSEAAAKFGSLFENHLVQKFYLALSDKKPRKKQGLISGDMARSRRSAWKLLPSDKNPAFTQFFSRSASPGERLFLCKPLTGKTHQIRVSLKSIGAPIIGDPIYNSQSQSDRGYLHAYCLSFEFEGENFSFRYIPQDGRWQSVEILKILEGEWVNPEALNWPVVFVK